MQVGRLRLFSRPQVAVVSSPELDGEHAYLRTFEDGGRYLMALACGNVHVAAASVVVYTREEGLRRISCQSCRAALAQG